MKRILLFLILLMVFASCTKETLQSSQNNVTPGNLFLTNEIHLRKDTTTQLKSISLSSGGGATLTTVYDGENYYSLTENPGTHQFGNGAYSYTLYKDNVAIQTAPLPAYSKFTISLQLSPGIYYIRVYATAQVVDSFQTNTITIISEPVAPAGMICLYRYYNSTTVQHICTSDWEELGSCSVGFSFEKVLGYMYSSSTAVTNLKPIYRYYNSSDGSHFTTDLLGSYAGFYYEKILGYVGISAITALSRSLTKYNYSGSDDHFVCVAPDVPNTPVYVKDIDFVFGYVQ